MDDYFVLVGDADEEAFSTMTKPTPAQIKALRLSLGENTATFAARFLRSGRTVEDWEQGKRSPDPVVAAMILKLMKRKQP